MASATAKLKYNCTDEVAEIIESPDWNREKSMMLTSQKNFVSVWREIEASFRTRINHLQFAYKLDSGISHFRVPTGIRFPSVLKRSQVWLRRRLRAIADSGLKDLWQKYERMKERADNAKMISKLQWAERQPKEIPLWNSYGFWKFSSWELYHFLLAL